VLPRKVCDQELERYLMIYWEHYTAIQPPLQWINQLVCWLWIALVNKWFSYCLLFR